MKWIYLMQNYKCNVIYKLHSQIKTLSYAYSSDLYWFLKMLCWKAEEKVIKSRQIKHALSLSLLMLNFSEKKKIVHKNSHKSIKWFSNNWGTYSKMDQKHQKIPQAKRNTTYST